MTQSSSSTGSTIPKTETDNTEKPIVGAAAVVPPTSSCGAQRGSSVGVPASDTSRKKRKISQTVQATSTKEGNPSAAPTDSGSCAMSTSASGSVSPHSKKDEQMSTSTTSASLTPAASAAPIPVGDTRAATDNAAPTASNSKTDKPISAGSGETNPAAPAQQRKSGSGKGTLEDPRRKQVLALISHRRLLLERMGQCRQAAEDRLDRIAQERRQQRREEAQRKRQETASTEGGPTSKTLSDSKKDTAGIHKSDKTADAASSKLSASSKENDEKNKTLEKESISDDDEDDDENEVEEFRKMTRLALQTNKRQKWEASATGGVAGGGEKGGGRGSISLRRGSSVGKKMAAAVNTLTNQGGWASDNSSASTATATTSAGSTAAHVPLHTASGAAVAHPGRGPVASSVAPAGTVPSSALPTGAPSSSAALAAVGTANSASLTPTPVISAPHGRKSSIMPHKQPQHPNIVGSAPAAATPSSTKISKSSSSSQLGGSKKQSSQKNKRSGSQKSMRGSSVGNGNSQTTTDSCLSSSQPLHYGAGGVISGAQTGGAVGSGRYHSGTMANGGAVGQQQQKQRSVAPVLCPEASALREKRNTIRLKLTKLLYERQLRTLDEKRAKSCGCPNAVRGLGTVAGADVAMGSAQASVRTSSVNISGRATTMPQQKQPHTVTPKVNMSAPIGFQQQQQQQQVSNEMQQTAWSAALAQTQGTARHLTPMRLPTRRKTHWDYVLEEMRWLSTDFIEERKWKIAAGRTLSCAIRSHCATPSASSPSKRKVPLVKDDESSKKKPPGQIGLVASEERREVWRPLQPEEDGMLTNAPNVDVEEEESAALYPDPTPEDLESARAASKLLSVVVMEHWDSVAERGSFAPSDTFYAAGHRRFCKMRQRHKRQDQQRRRLAGLLENENEMSIYENDNVKVDSSQSSSSVPIDASADVAKMSSSADKKSISALSSVLDTGEEERTVISNFSLQEYSYDQITELIRCAIKSSTDFKSTLDSDSSQHETDRYESKSTSEALHKELKGCALELNPVQMDAISFVENLWERDSRPSDSDTAKPCSDDEGKSVAMNCTEKGSVLTTSGAILYGGVGCGKTITVGALLWKHRVEGPQLIICPPTSVIRWRHELSRFHDLNVFTYGHLGWSYGHHAAPRTLAQRVSPYQPCDVVLCEFSAISLLFGDERKEGTTSSADLIDIAKFTTLTLDARYPVTFSPSHTSNTNGQSSNASLPSPSSPLKKKKKRSVPNKQRDDLALAMVPPELLSIQWWNNLLRVISSLPKMRRLILENSEFASHNYPYPSDCRPCGDDKRVIELLSMKVAFVHHPSIFHSTRSTIAKKVMSWAKRSHQKRSKYISNKMDSEAVSHVGGIRGVLQGTLSPFGMLHAENELEKYGDSVLRSKKEWEFRICPMPRTQRTAYDRCCSHIRGALSSVCNNSMIGGYCSSCLQSDIPFGSMKSDCSDCRVQSKGNMMCANALLRLRRVCLHSHLYDLLSISKTLPLLGTENCRDDLLGFSPGQEHSSRRNGISSMNKRLPAASILKGCVTKSPSDPNFELAQHIVENSCKMRELLQVLSNTCGYSVMYKDKLLDDKRMSDYMNDRTEPPETSESKKVLILATLPEAQLLVSMLLNAVGVVHETFLSTNLPASRTQHSPDVSYSPNDNDASTRSGNNTITSTALPIGILDYDEEGSYYCDTTKKIIHSVDSAVAWIRCQQILAKFDVEHCVQQSMPNVKNVASKGLQLAHASIIVASPVAVDSNHGGLCASAADVVISVDEDWSGRGDSLVHSILSRIHTRHYTQNTERSKCKFIKLISENTCEHLFFTNGIITGPDKTEERNDLSTQTNKAKGKNGVINAMEDEKEKDKGSDSDSIPPRRGKRRKKKTPMLEIGSENCISASASGDTNALPLCDKPEKINEPSSCNHWIATDRRGYILPSSVSASIPSTHKKGHHKPASPCQYIHKNCSFIGENIWKFRNTELSTVLCTPQPLPCTFLTGKDLLFLPTSELIETRAHIQNEGRIQSNKGRSNEQHCEDVIYTSPNVNGSDDVGGISTEETERGILFGMCLAQAEKNACPLSDIMASSSLTTRDALCLPIHDKFGHGHDDINPLHTILSHLLTIVPPFLSDFPPSIMSRCDITSMDIRRYVERTGRSSLQSRLRANPSNALSWQPSIAADTGATSTAEGVVSSKSDFDLADAWHKSGLGCKPDDLAASLLVYYLPMAMDTDKLTTQKKAESISSEGLVGVTIDRKEATASQAEQSNLRKDEESSIESSQSSHKRKRRSRSTGQGHNENKCDREHSGTKKRSFRTNFYSMSYASSSNARSTIIRDGNQGYEPLVYFPPLFPGMLLSARSATSMMEEIMNKSIQCRAENIAPAAAFNSAAPSFQSKKRKDHVISTVAASSGKRARHSSPTHNKATAADAPNSAHSSGLGVSPMVPASAQFPLSSLSVGTSKSGPGSPVISGSSIHFSSPLSNVGYTPSTVTTTPSLNIASTDQQGQYTSISKTRTLSTVVTEDESSDTDASKVLFEINDDFGVLGIGALPLQHESEKAAYATSIETNAYSFWRDHFEPNSFDNEEWSSFPICDAEEGNVATHGHGGQAYLDLMILFVKKRSQPVLGSNVFGSISSLSYGTGSGAYQSLLTSTQPSSLSTSSLLATLGTGSIAAVVNDKGIQYVSGGNRRSSSSGKKSKKGHQHHSSSAGSNNAHFSTGSMHIVSGAASHASALQPKQSGIFMRSPSGRFSGHSAAGRVFYERTPVRVASVRLRYRLSDRVSNLDSTSCGTSSPGPGIPSSLSQSPRENGYYKTWTNAVIKLTLPNGKTGDKARMTSNAQRASLRRSLVSPCRVDFGPFHVGYLSPPGGMTGISPPRTRVGISLPMGVKVPQHNREHCQQPSAPENPEPWTDSEDRKLKACVARFCFNWHMASRAVTRVVVGDIPRSIPHQTTGGRSVSQVFRSARQCRERWQFLAKTQPSLAKEVRRVERTLTDMAGRMPSEIPKSLGDIVREVKDSKKTTNRDDGACKGVATFKEVSLTRSSETRQPNKHSNSKDTLILRPFSLTATNNYPERNLSGLNPVIGSPPQPPTSIESSESVGKSGANMGNRMAALRAARQKRQLVPISIPGCVGNDPSTLQVVQSHQSHAQSVRAASSSVRGELWPLQLLDLAEKQRQAAEGVTQRQEVSTNISNTSRQHRGGVPAASHPPQPPVAPPQNIVQQQRTQSASYHQIQQQHHGATLAAPTSGIAAPMQTPTQQQELVKQAARAAALGSPAPKARPAPTSGVGIGTGPSQHTQQQQHAVPMLQQQPVPPQQVTYMSQTQRQAPQQVAGVGSTPVVMSGHQQAQPVDVSRMRHQPAGASTLPTKPPPP